VRFYQSRGRTYVTVDGTTVDAAAQ
jgi:hypothetical protein